MFIEQGVDEFLEQFDADENSHQGYARALESLRANREALRKFEEAKMMERGLVDAVARERSQSRASELVRRPEGGNPISRSRSPLRPVSGMRPEVSKPDYAASIAAHLSVAPASVIVRGRSTSRPRASEDSRPVSATSPQPIRSSRNSSAIPVAKMSQRKTPRSSSLSVIPKLPSSVQSLSASTISTSSPAPVASNNTIESPIVAPIYRFDDSFSAPSHSVSNHAAEITISPDEHFSLDLDSSFTDDISSQIIAEQQVLERRKHSEVFDESARRLLVDEAKRVEDDAKRTTEAAEAKRAADEEARRAAEEREQLEAAAVQRAMQEEALRLERKRIAEAEEKRAADEEAKRAAQEHARQLEAKRAEDLARQAEESKAADAAAEQKSLKVASALQSLSSFSATRITSKGQPKEARCFLKGSDLGTIILGYDSSSKDVLIRLAACELALGVKNGRFMMNPKYVRELEQQKKTSLCVNLVDKLSLQSIDLVLKTREEIEALITIVTAASATKA